MMKKRWYLALAFLIVLLLFASIPRIDEIKTVDTEQMHDYPILWEAYTDLCEEYSLYEIVTEDTIQIVTVKNLWGSWQRYVLPCYSAHVPTVPTAGSVSSHAGLYVLAPWSEENVFTDLYRLKVRDFSLRMEPGENLFVSEQAELTHANMYPVRYIVYARLISFKDAIICEKLPTVFVDYSVATNNSALEREQPATTVLQWEYSLRFMGKKLRTGMFVLEKNHVLNA